MDYVKILPDERLLKETAPPYVRSLLGNEGYENCILAAIDDGVFKGYGFFSHPYGSSRDIRLEYLYTLEEYRETGVACGILKFAEDYMKKKGVINIICRMYVKFSEAKEVASFFIRRGYIPLSLDGRLLAYWYKDMEDTGFFDIINEKRHKLPSSVKATDIDARSLNVLLSDAKDVGFSFDRRDLEKSYSRFMLNKDRIEAALIARKAGENVLYVMNPYIKEKSRFSNSFPVLFSDVINDVKKDSVEDFLVLLNLDDNKLYYAMMQYFNPPEKEYLIQEYMLCLKLPKKADDLKGKDHE